jgi:hypothetical protein
MATPERTDYELWRHPDGAIRSFPVPGANRLSVRAKSIKQAYWAATHLRTYDERRDIGPLPADASLSPCGGRQERSVSEQQADDEAVLYAALNVLQGAPEGPVTLHDIREWCETWQRPLDDSAITGALRRLHAYGFIRYQRGRGRAAIVSVADPALQRLATMREARTAVLRSRHAIH